MLLTTLLARDSSRELLLHHSLLQPTPAHPFRGVMYFITYESAEVVTTDGVHLLAGPCLVLLRHLDSQTRQHYEQQARQHAVVVAQQYRLYPEIIEENQIQAARIEAKLRGQPSQQKKKQPLLQRLTLNWLILVPINQPLITQPMCGTAVSGRWELSVLPNSSISTGLVI